MRYFWMTLMSVFALTFAGCGDKDDDTSVDSGVEQPADAGEDTDAGDAGAGGDTGDQDGGSEDE